jgi:biopolymer transport protein ExbB
MIEPMLANVLIDLFVKGGPIMWPILLAALAAIAVVGERVFWWIRHSKHRAPKVLAQVFSTLEAGDLARAIVVSGGSSDPALKMIHHGLRNYPTSMPEAMQVVAIDEVEKSGRFIPVMDTLITLSPLLGLLGTVTGIMGAFSSIGGSELAVEKVTGGIGEALIATAAGLGIAILCLLPYNWSNRRSSRLAAELQKVAAHLEGIMKRLNPTPVAKAMDPSAAFEPKS